MPESANARASQLNKLPEHAAAVAAVTQKESGHATAHEETLRSKEHMDEAGEYADKLHHGKEARLLREAAESAKK